ncbi:PRD domain-containing protein [Clostridium polynesiense]|uniref:PRD domain-containing protein n=1 Tax=Clostridium polynesiense TaxID=1325933 RepID=UPI00069441F8|nr:PRD domain-containing protein [Clostridium polynesiense]
MNIVIPYNNNIVLAKDDSGIEIILIGKGVGFSKKKGDKVDEKNVTQKFYPKTVKEQNKLVDMLNDIPVKVLDVTGDIIKSAEGILKKKLNPMVLVTIADHINCAVEREQQGRSFKSPLQEEIEYIYPLEYMAARNAVNLVLKETKIQLPESEVVYIAMHFVNAVMNEEDLHETMEITKILSEVLDIVRKYFKGWIHQNMPGYARFLAHLRYFVIRQLRMEKVPEEDMKELYSIAKRKYPEEFECVKIINAYLGEKYNMYYSDNEKFYLILHIARIRMKQ